MKAVTKHHNSVVTLLLKTPNIDVNLKSETGKCALYCISNTLILDEDKQNVLK